MEELNSLFAVSEATKEAAHAFKVVDELTDAIEEAVKEMGRHDPQHPSMPGREAVQLNVLINVLFQSNTAKEFAWIVP